MSPVQPGDHVHIHYIARFVDGSVFASSRGERPLEFTAAGTEVIEGISQAVLGMSVGESKIVTLTPELAYGPRDSELEQSVLLTDLPPGVKVGDALSAQAGDRVIPVWVREISDQNALLDANHPLAGHNLIFEIELVSFHS